MLGCIVINGAHKGKWGFIIATNARAFDIATKTEFIRVDMQYVRPLDCCKTFEEIRKLAEEYSNGKEN